PGEPLQRQRKFSLKNLAPNGLNHPEVIIQDQGISSFEGTENFLDRGYGSRIPRAEKERKPSLSMRWKALLVLLGLRKEKNQAKTIVPIRTITLDILVDRIGRAIDLLQV